MLLATSKPSSPINEVVRVLGLKQMQDDRGWYIMRMNMMRTGTMQRTYILAFGKSVPDHEIRGWLDARLQPLGWIRTDTGTEADAVTWEKDGCNLGFARDTTNPAQHWVFVERPQSALERLKDNLIP